MVVLFSLAQRIATIGMIDLTELLMINGSIFFHVIKSVKGLRTVQRCPFLRQLLPIYAEQNWWHFVIE